MAMSVASIHIIQTMLHDAFTRRVNDLQSSLDIGQRALDLSREAGDIELIAKSLTHLALFNMIVGEHEKSIDLSQLAIYYYQILGDEKGVADARYNLAGVYYKTDNYHLGMVVLIDCLEIFTKYNDFSSCSKAQKSLGTIYEYFGDTINAVKSYELGIDSARKAGNLNLESNIYCPLSGILAKQGKLAEAMDMILQAFTLKTETGDSRGIAFALYGRAKVYVAQEKYELAEKDFLSALEIHQKFHERLGVGMTLNKLGHLYSLMGNREKAKSAVEMGMDFCGKYGISLFESKCCYQLAFIYQVEGQFQKAFELLNKYQRDREAMIDAQTKRVIDNYEAISKMKTLELEAKAQKEKAEIIEKKNRAEEAVRIKQEFLSTMSHEIRTPLNGIVTVANLLNARANPEDQKLLESLRFSGNNLMRIVNDILDFTKLESGKMELDLRSGNLLNCLENTYQNFRALAYDKGLKFIVRNDPSLATNYEMDETRLSQVMGNLISNAIKFTSQGQIIVQSSLLERRGNEDTIRFEVTDSGEGIAPKFLDEIFVTFAQPRSVATRKQGGTGLGLAIVKHIIELHHSQIHVKSTIGIGTTFYFDLQLKKIQSGKINANRNLDLLKGKLVLLAEDNAINAMVATKLLSDWGMTFDHAENGKIAHAFSLEKKYDFILMDIHMPEMSGYEAAKLIRGNDNINHSTTMFALTADITADSDAEFKSYFDGILTKPIDIERMQTVLLSKIECTN